ncbi:MAG TPA: lytic transglycosylase domain-containing protein [Pseudolabrys sp.]|nr:lytic transglycosylase domain-containing protein [Pseudolabrys sp.]
MRHFFVPACLCLATLSGSLGSDPKLSLADIFRTPFVKEKAALDALPGDSGESTQDKDRPRDTTELSMFSSESSEPAELLQAPPLPPVPKPVVHRSRDEICDTLTQAAQSNDVPAPFFIRLLFQESGFKPGVVSSAGAEGIAQFMPETSASMGLDNPFDPLPAIQASARLLRGLMRQFGNLGLAAAAYNAGPKRIEDWLAKKGKLPHETQGYVKSITGREAKNWIVAEAGSPAVKLPQRAPCQQAAGLLAWNGPAHIPLPHTRTPTGNTMIAAGAHVKRASVTAAIPAAKPGKSVAAAKTTKPTVQLAAAKQKHHKLQLSQR